MVEIICAFCEGTKLAPASEVKRGQHKYCSKTCYGKATLLEKRGVASKMKVCAACEKEFEGRVDSKCCSVECQGNLHSGWVKENQSGENNAFYNKKHTLETRKKMSSTRKELFAKGILVHPLKGKGKGTGSPRGSDSEWKHIVPLILGRDGYKCVLCDSDVRLEVHHIIPHRERLEHKENNLVTLCREHHKKMYRKEKDFAEILFGKIGLCYG